MPSLPGFFLVNPVARSLVIGDRFNAPRNYTFAPTKKQLHEGIDLMAIDSQGNPVAVMAAQRGVVDKVGYSPEGYGNYVRILHDWGNQTYVTWYGHLSSVAVHQNQFVLSGQKIGVAGTTGFSTGIHLHLTLQHIGHGFAGYTVDDVIDPEPFLRQSPVAFDEASFLADVTVADGTQMQAGQTFRKTWRIRNSGTTTWDGRYKLVPADGDHMSGPDEVMLPTVPIQPGQTVNLTIRLTAPDAAGRHRSVWQLRDGNGELFPNSFYTEVEVKETKAFDEASYVADVTIPDATVIQPGDTFVKTWRVRNTGTTSWSTDYALRFSSGDRMDGPDSVPVPREVKPGDVVELSVRLKAPTQSGRHRSAWKLSNARGTLLDYEQYAEIQVPQKVVSAQKLSELSWVADVTVPDGAPLDAGEQFVKTWRVRNSGETTWGAGYELAFFGDDQMDGPDSVPLPPAKPGEAVEVSVMLTAPDKSGSQRSTWKPRDPQGKFFEFDLYALIDVRDQEQPSPQLSEMAFIADVTIPDGTVMQPGEAFVKTWRVRNTGTTAWGAGHTLAYFAEDKMDGPDSVPLPGAQPGDVVDVSLMLTAPAASGMHKSTWKGRDPQAKFFDYDLFILVDVVDPNQVYSMLPFIRGDGRLYELQYTWSGGGRQRIQTQIEGDRFYHVKGSEWEELWADDHFICRGTDTSPGGGEVYTLFDHGEYGSAWVPLKMSVGVPFRRSPNVVFRRKSDGSNVPNKQYFDITWITLEAVQKTHRFDSGIELENVAVLAAFLDDNGKPKSVPFERYYYAEKYGLVGWEGDPGHSFIASELTGQPNLVREAIPWLKR